MQVDYYEVLGVDPTASADEIHKAWLDEKRKWMRRQSVSDGKAKQAADRQVLLIDEAQDALLDPGKRKVYNQKRAEHERHRQELESRKNNEQENARLTRPLVPFIPPTAPEPQRNFQQPDRHVGEYASLSSRLASYIIDITLMYFLMFLTFGAILHSFYLIAFLLSFLYVCYFPFCWSRFGSTLGQWLTHTAVVDANTRNRISIGQSIVRFIGFLLFGTFWYFSIWGLMRDQRRQGWHDKMTSSVVVNSGTRGGLSPAFYDSWMSRSRGTKVAVVVVVGVIIYIVASVGLNSAVSTVPRPKGATDARVLESVAAQIQSCVQSAVAQPANCPQGSTNPSSDASSIVWTLFGDSTRAATVTYVDGSKFRVNGRFVMTLQWESSSGKHLEVVSSPYIAEVNWSHDQAVLTSITADTSGTPEAPLLPRPAGATDAAALAAIYPAFKSCVIRAATIAQPVDCPLFGQSLDSSDTNIHWTLQSDVTLNARVTFDNTTGLVHVIGSFAMMLSYTDSSGNMRTDHQSGNYEALLAWQANKLTVVIINQAAS